MGDSQMPRKGFVPQAISEHLDSLNQALADQQSFGIIGLDVQAIVRIFNKAEERLSGLPASEVLNHSFFDDVAPCTASRLFRGRFLAGLERGSLDEHFFYTFTYRIRPVSAHIHMLYRPAQSPLVFLFVDRVIPLFEDLG